MLRLYIITLTGGRTVYREYDLKRKHALMAIAVEFAPFVQGYAVKRVKAMLPDGTIENCTEQYRKVEASYATFGPSSVSAQCPTVDPSAIIGQ